MKDTELSSLQSSRLIFFGILLFFLGLVVGLAVPAMGNPRMGVSSHLEGVMNGIFLVVLGLIWDRVQLSERWLTITFWLAIYGTFINWLGVFIAAVFNAGGMMNIAAGGKKGEPLVEAIVTFSLISLSLAMLIVCVAVLIGLNRSMKLN